MFKPDESRASNQKNSATPTSSTDVSTLEYQRLAWGTLIETINLFGNQEVNDQVKKVNKSNVPKIARKLFKCNILRGRGILTDALIHRQIASPSNAPVYAALMSIINSKFPEIGMLTCKRVIKLYQDSYMDNDKGKCLAITKYLAHLINQRVLNELIAIQLLRVLLDNYTNDSVELPVELLKECGEKLLQDNQQELDSIFVVLENLLHARSLKRHTKDMIRDLFTVPRDGFQEHPAIQSGVNLAYENGQLTHKLQLLYIYDPEIPLNVFRYDAQYEVTEKEHKEMQKSFDENSNDEDESSSNTSDNHEDQSNSGAADNKVSSPGQSDNDKENQFKKS